MSNDHHAGFNSQKEQPFIDYRAVFLVFPLKYLWAVVAMISVQGCSHNIVHDTHSVKAYSERVGKKNVWIFVMAGQSNMAGRAAIEPEDTVIHDRILTVNTDNELVKAKEPIHFYEPDKAGLDCGISFGLSMLKEIPEQVYVLLVPTAIGGSAIEQWSNDSTHRGVKLLSNFKTRLEHAQTYGKLKGIIWHQGESDTEGIALETSYRREMERLFNQFREMTKQPSLPIVVGKLGSFSKNQKEWDMINKAISLYVQTDHFCTVVETADLVDKGDQMHFDSQSQRKLGERYAKAMLEFMM